MTSPALALFLREWRIARRIGGGASIGAAFFLILVTIMPFALGPDMILLAKLSPAIMWIAALLATLLGLDRLFQGDSDDGSLDVLVNSALPLEIVVLLATPPDSTWRITPLPTVVLSVRPEPISSVPPELIVVLLIFAPLRSSRTPPLCTVPPLMVPPDATSSVAPPLTAELNV